MQSPQNRQRSIDRLGSQTLPLVSPLLLIFPFQVPARHTAEFSIYGTHPEKLTMIGSKNERKFTQFLTNLKILLASRCSHAWNINKSATTKIVIPLSNFLKLTIYLQDVVKMGRTFRTRTCTSIWVAFCCVNTRKKGVELRGKKQGNKEGKPLHNGVYFKWCS